MITSKNNGAIPQQAWIQWSGRRERTIEAQAERYGLPLADDSIELRLLVPRAHDLLDRNAEHLAGDVGGDPLLVGGDSPALERYRAARAESLRLDRRLREEDLLDRRRAHERLGQAAGILRGAAETLQRQYGPEAHAVLAEALDDAVAEVQRRIPEETKGV